MCQRKQETKGEGKVKESWHRQTERVRAGPRNKPTQKKSHVPFRDWCTHCMTGRGRTHHHVTKRKSEDQSRSPAIAMVHYFMNRNSVVNTETMSE